MLRFHGLILSLICSAGFSVFAADGKLPKDLADLDKLQGACFLLGDHENMDPDASKSALKALKADCKKGLAKALALMKQHPASAPVREAAQKIADSAAGAGIENKALNAKLEK